MKHCFIFLTTHSAIVADNMLRRLHSCKGDIQKSMSLKAIMKQLGCINFAKLFYVTEYCKKKIIYMRLLTRFHLDNIYI